MACSFNDDVIVTSPNHLNNRWARSHPAHSAQLGSAAIEIDHPVFGVQWMGGTRIRIGSAAIETDHPVWGTCTSHYFRGLVKP